MDITHMSWHFFICFFFQPQEWMISSLGASRLKVWNSNLSQVYILKKSQFTHIACFRIILTTLKIILTSFSGMPWYWLAMLDGVISIVFTSAWWANAFAISVFPVPGGPCNSTFWKVKVSTHTTLICHNIYAVHHKAYRSLFSMGTLILIVAYRYHVWTM